MTGQRIWWLTAPALIVTAILLGGPMIYLLVESFRTFVPGRLSSLPVFTWENYRALLDPAYRVFLGDTLRIAFYSAIISAAIGFILAHYLVCQASRTMRALVLMLVVALMFIGIARVFSLSLAFGNYGILSILRRLIGIRGNEYVYLQSIVIAGIVHYTAPIATLTMVGYLAGIDRRLSEAAQSLGASRLQAFASIFLPLALPGLVAVLLTSFALAVSAFSVPVIVGRGLVPTMTTLIYQRFSETPNYPSGAALSVSLFLISVAIIALSTVAARVLRSRLGRAVP